jgi:serine/threonine-protein kinase RsbW
MPSEPAPQPQPKESAPGVRLRVTIPADAEEIPPIVEAVVDIARELQWSDEKQLQLAMCVQEALANAVVHGCKRDRSKSVECWAAAEPDRGILVVVSDPGPGFDLASLPSPKSGDNLYADHGRGIYLIRSLMDEIEFERNGAEIRMRKF